MKGTPGRIVLRLRQQEKQWQHQGQTLLTARLELPDTDTPGAAGRRFRRYYRLFARSFFRYCQKQLLPAALARQQAEPGGLLLPAAAVLKTEVTLQQGKVLSLYTQLEENTAGRRFLIRRGDSWDLEQGLPLRLEELFAGSDGLSRRLRQSLCRQLRARLEQEPAAWRADALRRCRRFFKRENFYLSPRGLHLFYPMYALGGAERGIVDFLLPWQEQGPRLPPQPPENA